MKLDKDARKLTKGLFQLSLTNGRLDDKKVSAVVKKVIADKPRSFVGILKEYQRLVRLEVAKHHAVIESATPLDKKGTEQLLAKLQAKYGRDLTTEFKVSPSLLGGLRIKIGSDVFDSSVRERLARLETQLTQA
ncbi:MAG: ATP synthase F1 subunit delta [Chthoniobacter sp.]|nr:ATP synthase F1 subunit delta [Chthoniobacter sp.]